MVDNVSAPYNNNSNFATTPAKMHMTSSQRTSRLAQKLVQHIRLRESVAVAFSGGVDSAVVAKAACIALDENSIAVTAVSPSLASSERDIAKSEAAAIGIRHLEISTNEFSNKDYRANAGDRCFFCKDTLYQFTIAELKKLGVACIMNGANSDDAGDHRPGMQAARNHEVQSPLLELGIGKSDVRELARFWKLSVSEKPASPCLSSRIAYGVELTEERVLRIEHAEKFLRNQLAWFEFRVRLEAGELARIEVPLHELGKITDAAQAVSAEFRRLGFRRVTLDLEGFRSGSLNEALPLVSLGIEPTK